MINSQQAESENTMTEQFDVMVKNFHAHLDGCERCRENPFDLCAHGANMLLQIGRKCGAGFTIAQSDDPELLEWLTNAEQKGGGFISRISGAALRADFENYPLIRPLILQMREKYPEYDPTESVKREIRERRT